MTSDKHLVLSTVSSPVFHTGYWSIILFLSFFITHILEYFSSLIESEPYLLYQGMEDTVEVP
jgi:hypothetical protein